MKALKIKKLRVDEREFVFRPGINVLVGSNGSGKTTIFNAIKLALGVAVDSPGFFFRQVELLVFVGTVEYRFLRERGSVLVHVESEEGSAAFRARSTLLDDFFQKVFEPKFFIGSRLTSIFPILDFCFISDETRLNSRSLLAAVRLICGANDKLIDTASKDIEVLRAQILAEELFLNRNDAFVEDFRRRLGPQQPQIEQQIDRSLMSVREDIVRPIDQKREVLVFSTARIEELARQNEDGFFEGNWAIEQSFSVLLDRFSNSRIETLKLKDVLTRDMGNISYGEAVFADLVMLLAIARAMNFVEINYPKIYLNDGMGSRSLDDYYTKKIHGLLEVQSGNDEEFQYIEFSSNINVPPGFVVADLNKGEWRI